MTFPLIYHYNNKNRIYPLLLLLLLCSMFCFGCIKLDFFVFEGDKATSVEEDYHGLPLFQGINPPSWIEESLVERELFLNPQTGELIENFSETQNTIHGAFLKAPNNCPETECPLINKNILFLYQHGNSGNLWRYWYRTVALWNLGAHVFVYDYRGYGLSKGEATGSHVCEDSDAALKYVLNRPEYTPGQTQIIVYGYSMGAIPTSYLIGRSEQKEHIAGAIMESGLDSPISIVQLSTGTEFPASYFIDETEFDGPTYLKGTNPELPILHLHGGKDNRVIDLQAERYFSALKSFPNYTYYLGKTDAADETWISRSGHRNIPNSTFQAELHLADYWDDSSNPAHCCVHPLEFANPEHQNFYQKVGLTTQEDLIHSANQYKNLIATWVLAQVVH